MKYKADRPYADSETAARKIVELANEFEPIQDGRIYIEKINGPFLFRLRGSPAEYEAGLDPAIANGWLVLHESGTFVKFTQVPTAVITYIRVSTDKQGKSGLRLEAQREAVARFAAAEALEVTGEFIEVETGKGADALEKRPQLAAALRGIRNPSQKPTN